MEYAPEPDLQGIQPLPYEASENDVPTSPVSSDREIRRLPFRRGSHMRTRGSGNRSDNRFEPRNSGRAQHRPADRRSRVNLDSWRSALFNNPVHHFFRIRQLSVCDIWKNLQGNWLQVLYHLAYEMLFWCAYQEFSQAYINTFRCCIFVIVPL